MKFTKFFTDFTAGYTERDKKDPRRTLCNSVIQFVRLKLILDMIKNNMNRVDHSRLTDSEKEAASLVGNDATLLFASLFESQISIANADYSNRMAALPKRLQVAFRMSMVSNLPDGETTYRDGSLFSVTSRNAGLTGAEFTAHHSDEIQAEKLAMVFPDLRSIEHRCFPEIFLFGDYHILQGTTISMRLISRINNEK